MMIPVGCEKPAPPPRPAVPVSVAAATVADVPVQIHAIGNVEPLQTVAVRSQVGGELVDVSFEEGQEVQAGQALFRIDPRPYQAALAREQANLERDRALQRNAEQDAKRYEELARKDYVTQEQYGKVKSGAEAAGSTLQADEAAVEQARLELEYCSIRAPITGRAGSLMVKRGNVVKANSDAPLVVIHQIRPILVAFAVPAQNLPDIQRFSARRALTVKVYPARDGREAVAGKVVFIDNAVDPTTDTITLKARFENEDRLLWPGQFLDVVLELDVLPHVIVIPSEAVQTGQLGTTVFVVQPGQTAMLRQVKLGRSVDDAVVVESGVSAGERVVTDGQLRLVPGAKVEIKPRVGSTTTGAAR